jgi:uncharacterized protein
MIFRKLGRTGVDVSVIGLGSEYIWHSSAEDVLSVVNEALENGVNYIDIFMGTPSTRDYIGYALKGRRENVLLAGHLGCAEKDGQYYKTRDKVMCDDFINQFYQRLQTDYIDVLFLHNCNEIVDFEEMFSTNGILNMALKLKIEGKARFIGFSCHNTLTAFKAVQSGYVDVLMFPINPVFDALPRDTGIERMVKGDFDNFTYSDEKNGYLTKKELYHACAMQNVGIVAMKPYAAGRLFTEKNPAFITLTPIQCISYIISQPGVSSVVPGCKNAEEVKAALAYIYASEEEKDFSIISNSSLWKLKASCMYCNHCLPCPVGIDVAAITRLSDTAACCLTDSIISQYGNLSIKAAECIKCRSCMERCPFGVNIIDNMKRAVELFDA